MDRVRFGRALGYGARHAARSVVQAVDAAAAPRPAPASSKASPGPSLGPVPDSSGASQIDAHPPAAAPGFTSGAASFRQGGHLRRSLGSPLAKFSRVVWLQVTGTFFTLIALFLSQGLWKQRSALHLPLLSAQAEKLYLHGVAFAVFAYFAASSFVRAHLRQRR